MKELVEKVADALVEAFAESHGFTPDTEVGHAMVRYGGNWIPFDFHRHAQSVIPIVLAEAAKVARDYAKDCWGLTEEEAAANQVAYLIEKLGREG